MDKAVVVRILIQHTSGSSNLSSLTLAMLPQNLNLCDMIEITDDIRAYVDNAVQRLMNDGCSRMQALSDMYLGELVELNDLGNDEDDRRTVMARLIYIDQLIDAERFSDHVRRVAQTRFTLDELVDEEMHVLINAEERD